MNRHRSSTRWAAAACLTVTAAVHLDIAPAHLREAPYAGVLFLVLSAAALTSATLLFTTADRLAWASAAGLSLGALVAYLISRSVGLPSLGDDVGDWLNPLGVTAVLSESAVALIAWQVLFARRRYRTVTATDRLYTVVPATSDGASPVG